MQGILDYITSAHRLFAKPKLTCSLHLSAANLSDTCVLTDVYWCSNMEQALICVKLIPDVKPSRYVMDKINLS